MAWFAGRSGKRGRSDTSRMGRGGTGLGLHIAHKIVANVLGGRISAIHIEGQGTTFEIAPQVAPQPQAVETAPDSSPAGLPGSV